MYKYYNWKNEINIDELEEVVNALKNDAVVVFPTETVYGIGGNAFSETVINRVYEAKKRPREKAINILVANKNQIEQYAQITSDLERKLIEKYMPGPITIILKKAPNFGQGFTADNDTIGVRIPDNKIMQAILNKIEFPLIAPSANISGMPSGTNIDKIINDFKESADIIIDGGESKIGKSSTIVQVVNEQIKILRQGSLKI